MKHERNVYTICCIIRHNSTILFFIIKIREEMNMEYKEKIIEMVNEISRKDILRYIYIIISDIIEEEKEEVKRGNK